MDPTGAKWNEMKKLDQYPLKPLMSVTNTITTTRSENIIAVNTIGGFLNFAAGFENAASRHMKIE